MPWVKGQSGNPGGRPRIVQAQRRKAQNVADEMLDILIAVARNSEKGSERSGAAVKVLQIAGVPFAAAGDPTGADEPSPPLGNSASVEELEAAAAKGEA